MANQRDRSASPEPIAIVGIGCRFPGGVDSPERFWELLCNGTDAIGEFPQGRFNIDEYYDPTPATPGKIVTRQGGFLEEVDRFDADFFGISPREAMLMDPQQRLLLETAWDAVDDAGLAQEDLAGSRSGVYVGLWLNDYESLLYDSDDIELYSTTGGGRYPAAGRLSFTMDLRGPCLTVDTACSSSLVAIHLAVQGLRAGETSFALAGGVNVILQPYISLAYSRSGMLAPDGRCKFGDAKADGYVRSDGCGVVALKRLSDALTANDRVYAVIRGSAVNNDGKGSGFLVQPSVSGQAAMLHTAYSDAGVDPSLVQFVEAHGTGTLAGDPVELQAIGEVLGRTRHSGRPCLVGSVKSNIGHTEGAAGVAGLIKVALALAFGEIPGNLHHSEPNPRVPWDELNVAIPTRLTPWLDGDAPRYAGVSAFGITGTNAHLVLASAPERSPVDRTGSTPGAATLLPLSARSEPALRQLARAYADLLRTNSTTNLSDLAFTAATRRSHLPERLTATGDTSEALANRLETFAKGQPAAGVTHATSMGQRPRLVFVFPGQGGQWHGMGRKLAATEPVFAAALMRCSAAIEAETGWSLWDVLHASDESRLAEIAVVQPAIFGIQVALAALLDHWGLRPDVVVGHSLGEVAAAHVAGILSLDDAAAVICRRSRLLTRVAGRGGMGVVDLSLAEAEELLAQYAGRLTVAASNGPATTVLAGDAEDLEHALGIVQARGGFARRVRVDVASHSPQVEPLLADLRASLRHLAPRQAQTGFASTVTGCLLDGPELDGSYWARNLRQPVLFAPVIIDLLRGGETAFVEISPHPVLLGSIQDMTRTADGPSIAVAGLRREQDEDATLREAVGELWAAGVPINWENITPGRVSLPLPRYPWQRERFWFAGSRSAPQQPTSTVAIGDSRNSLLGPRLPDLAHLPGSRFWQGRVEPTDSIPTIAVAGVPIIPGMYAALIAGAAAAEAGGRAGDLMLAAHPLLTTPVETQTILISGTDSGAASLQVFTRHSCDEAWTLWAAARFVEASPETIAVDLTALQSRLDVDARVDDGVTEWSQRPNERLRRLSPCGPDDQSTERRLATAVESVVNREPDLLSLLARVSSISMPAPDALTDIAWTYERQCCDGAPGADIQFLNRDGVAIATLVGVTSEPPDEQLISQAVGTKVDDWNYVVEWRPADTLPRSSTATRFWLILGNPSEPGGGLAPTIEQRGGRVWILPEVGADPDCLQALLREALNDAGDEPIGIVDCRSLQRVSDDVPDAAVTQAASALTLIQTVARMTIRSDARVWFVTRGAQPAGNAVTDAAGASLWGLGRVVANEHPELWGGLIDIDAGTVAQQAETLVDLILSGGSEDEVALRAGRCLVPRLTRRSHERGERVAIHADATYVITGGAGGIGLAVARWMADQGARNLVLIGRSQLSPQAATAIAAIEKMGACVEYMRGDIASRDDVASIVSTISDRWPPLRGIVHGAGVLSDATILQLTPSDLHSVIAPKVAGAWNLVHAARDAALDFVALFSSVSAYMGTPGQGNYAAANAVLDSYASLLRAAGTPAVSIAWGRWGEVGLVNTEGRIAGLDRLGLVPIAPAGGVEAFARAAGASDGYVVVADVQWDRFGNQRLRIPPRFKELVPDSASGITSDSNGSTSIREQLESAPTQERHSLLLDHVRTLAAVVLRFDSPQRIHPGHGFFQMGMDSLTAVELKNHLQHSLALTLPATLTFDYPTPTTLTQRLIDDLFPQESVSATRTEPLAGTGDVLELSQQQVRDLLDAELQLIEKELFR